MTTLLVVLAGLLLGLMVPVAAEEADPQVDLVVDLTDRLPYGPDPVDPPGSEFVLAVFVSNEGPDAAGPVKAHIKLGSGSEAVAIAARGWDCRIKPRLPSWDSDRVSCKLRELGPGEAAPPILLVVESPDHNTRLKAKARVKSRQVELAPGSNVDRETTRVKDGPGMTAYVPPEGGSLRTDPGPATPQIPIVGELIVPAGPGGVFSIKVVKEIPLSLLPLPEPSALPRPRENGEPQPAGAVRVVPAPGYDLLELRVECDSSRVGVCDDFVETEEFLYGEQYEFYGPVFFLDKRELGEGVVGPLPDCYGEPEEEAPCYEGPYNVGGDLGWSVYFGSEDPIGRGYK